jgi:hypothetical protein
VAAEAAKAARSRPKQQAEKQPQQQSRTRQSQVKPAAGGAQTALPTSAEASAASIASAQLPAETSAPQLSDRKVALEQELEANQEDQQK